MAIQKAQTPELGDRVEDRLTHQKGIVVAVTDWLYLCRTIMFQPEVLHEGKPVESRSVDEGQLKVLVKGVHKPRFPREAEAENEAPLHKIPARTGGPQREVKRPQ